MKRALIFVCLLFLLNSCAGLATRRKINRLRLRLRADENRDDNRSQEFLEKQVLSVADIKAMTEIEVKQWIAMKEKALEKLELKGLCTEQTMTCTNGQPMTFFQAAHVNGCGPEMKDYPTVEAIITGLSNGLTPFESCCDIHDNCYGGMGSFLQMARKQCDDNFYSCMKDRSGYNPFNYVFAFSFYEAVRNFGCSSFANARIFSNCQGGLGTSS